MGKYEEYSQWFSQDYEQPVVDDYIVGFSGLDPDKKVKPELINHEELDGLLGGDFAGRYHLTQDQVSKLIGYQDQIDTVREDAETKIARIKSEALTAIGAVDERLSDVRESLDGRMTEVEQSQSELETSQESISTRFEAILEGATEDTEILDARVDADNVIHQNLGHNVRNLHSLIKQLFGDAEHKASEIQELLGRFGELAQTDKQLHDELNAEKIARTEDDVYLQREIDTLSEGQIEQTLNVLDLNDRRKADIQAEGTARREADDDLRIALTAETETRTAETEEINRKTDGNTSAIERERKRLDETTELLRQESEARITDDKYLSNTVEELAEGFITDLLNFHDALERRKEALQREINARIAEDTRLQEQINRNSEDIHGNSLKIREETKERKQWDEEIRGCIESESRERINGDLGLALQAEANAEANILNTLNIEDVNDRRKADLAGETRERIEADRLLQDEINDNSTANIQHSLSLAHEADERRKLAQAVANLKSPADWSSAESLAIPEPRCAVVNFTGLNAMPTSKTADIPAVMEFWDRQGNFFRKNILCSAQGNSSLGYIKKNVKFDLLNEDGSEFNLRIGSWVVQDGFHLKAYYTDFFRGVGAVSYKLWEEIMKTKPHKSALIDTEGMNTTANGEGNIADLTLQIDTGALCHPDGFPCIVYLNGEFYGIFSWQIKKQRKNYHMDKSTVEHIHLDGTLYTGYFWNGVINWTAFEIRNPNKLYTMDGKKYDGDAPKELIDETSEKYDPDNKDHKRTAKVKKYIQGFVQNFSELKTLYTAYTRDRIAENLAAVKAKYEQIFDMENQRDYLIFSDIIKNSDGLGKNWQWTTYDGVKWFVNAYDLDMSFGGHWQGIQITPPLTAHITTSTAIPTVQSENSRKRTAR